MGELHIMPQLDPTAPPPLQVPSGLQKKANLMECEFGACRRIMTTTLSCREASMCSADRVIYCGISKWGFRVSPSITTLGDRGTYNFPFTYNVCLIQNTGMSCRSVCDSVRTSAFMRFMEAMLAEAGRPFRLRDYEPFSRVLRPPEASQCYIISD